MGEMVVQGRDYRWRHARHHLAASLVACHILALRHSRLCRWCRCAYKLADLARPVSSDLERCRNFEAIHPKALTTASLSRAGP